MIKDAQLKYIIGAYFSGKGYCCETSPEVPDSNCSPDVIAIKPRAKEVKLRLEKGGAPAGLISGLTRKRWTPEHEIVKKTGYPAAFVGSVLREAEENGWVKSKESNGHFSWAINSYRVPASRCLMIMSAAEGPEKALATLRALKGCYHQGYLAFPYRVDEKFLSRCRRLGAGVMVFDEKAAS
ncbi:MAG: hypothetical protein PHN75_20020, partial [Syntrophales bacterium]|nr:hypothetical protein [Syntrophales bacterium]